MNLRDLRYLVAAADTEHFGRAAEQCHVSQPTLSGQIRKLEDTLGVALFERSHRSVMLTDAGREVAVHAREILEQVRQLETVARSRQDPLSGELRIGVIPTLCAYLLPHLLPQLKQKYPGMHLVVFEETTEQLIARLREHEIDGALLATNHASDELVDLPLFTEPLWVAMPKQHKLAGENSVNTTDLQSEPLLLLAEGHCLAERVKDLCGIGLQQSLEGRHADLRATSLETLLQLVTAGQGITLIPELAAEHAKPASGALVFKRLDVTNSHRQIRLVHRRSHRRPEALQALQESITEAVTHVASSQVS